MISLSNLAEAIMNKFKQIESRKMVQETVSIGSNWVAPHDGIVMCSGRARSAGAYRFCQDKTDNTYVGMCTISNTDGYGCLSFAVIKGHRYAIIESNWYEPRDLYVYTE